MLYFFDKVSLHVLIYINVRITFITILTWKLSYTFCYNIPLSELLKIIETFFLFHIRKIILQDLPNPS